MAMGKSARDELPTLYVNGPQLLMRESDGCMRRNLSAFRNPVGCRWSSPIWKRVFRPAGPIVPEMFAAVVLPAGTVTDVVAILNSVWYKTIVYVPGFIAGEVKPP